MQVNPELQNLIDNYKVPEQLVSSNPKTDHIWEALGDGLRQHDMDHINAETGVDDLISECTNEWLKMMQATRNMAAIFNVLVDKYDIKKNDLNPQLPECLNLLWRTAGAISDIESWLCDHKTVYFTLEKIRRDWGSLDAYSKAPLAERNLWFSVNSLRSGDPTELLISYLRTLITEN